MRVNWQFIKTIPEPRLLHKGRNVLSLKKATCDRIDSHLITISLSTMSLIQSSFFATRITLSQSIKKH